ncbi:MAG: T9SS type A sorting domain-containing protein [Bacteroidota bacterium]|nr:T9SS type A sorting domain-containing protein [Bacteroidota bacterium]MDP4230482.1 T9SS type A sorting domain-containing protein [Bacteroidota bacterium]MDP4236446.1 T9SS type A sorting domain-containing protein [Bacteroidota bacterium]
MLKRISELVLIVAAIFCFGESYGQVSSVAFDPSCYFPKIGVQGEIDTIYGAAHDQYLGNGMLNIGPARGNPFGRMTSHILNDGSQANQDIFSTGHDFDLHNLQLLGKNFIRNIIRRGHFRSPKYSDLVCWDHTSLPAKIDWQDDAGNYDSSRYTILMSSVEGKEYNDYSPMMPYTTYISSDSVEDIINMVVVADSTEKGKIYLLYFKGGSQLYEKGKIAVADSVLNLQDLANPHSTIQGDFRGVGRNDLLIDDYSQNILYFKNDPPFSLSSFSYALRYDTIFAQWQNPEAHNAYNSPRLAMRALPKLSEDSSQDFINCFGTSYGGQGFTEFRFFKGGKDFGSHRWTADSAAFVLHEPAFRDPQYMIGFGNHIYDCGDMTGTGNRMLYVEGSRDGLFYGYHFFYVLGAAIDDKVDMFIGPVPNDGQSDGAIDTLVADNDNLQDVIMGLGGFGLNSGNESNGTIYLIHGSNKIPDRTSSVSARRSVDESPSHILAYPNPCSGHTVLTFDNCSASKMKIQVVSMSGVEVLQDETPAVDGLQQYAVDLSTVPAGEYIVNLSCPLPGWSSSVKVIKQGAAVKPWTFDLKKMVRR